MSRILLRFALLVLLTGAVTSFAAGKELVFGMLLVGPYNDHGWSQAHYEGGRYLERKIPGARMIYIDKVNPADRPGVTVPMVVDDLVDKGATLIVANSDDMKDGIREAALQHPEVKFVHISGDDVLTGKAPENLSNLMGRMVYGKMMAGFTAALKSRSGRIAYLGPLINDETRRLAVAAWLGARYAWTEVLGKPADQLRFKVSWIGFWFNIPGVTADPNQVVRNFFDSGYDVVLSGIDTTEAIVVAQQKRLEGQDVFALPYDYVGSCQTAPEACLGVPYFNWGPEYVKLARSVLDGTWKQRWIWAGPDWKDINDPDTSAVGFLPGPALDVVNKERLQAFITGLGDGSIQLFRGPLDYQDGTPFLKAGEIADDKKIWYMQQLLKGMEGPSK
ncbi:MAG TPA: BMP family ABC transporter substrate-binding protein [Sedimenticola thiotaurini]|uniref:BMP family ABC transporter substrate-binding protein n=1 Tax=Sedimenticola thiotaurini TaxID=1543721 RepID=A0A831RK00_9GAMM|nr:BMP family ABC transporter substrate-binding protein [Sedimenticola thiotaurini]